MPLRSPQLKSLLFCSHILWRSLFASQFASFPVRALDTDLTTFTGDVSQVCEFHGLDDFSLNYVASNNRFTDSTDEFEVSSNLSSVRLSIASVSANLVPSNIPNLRVGVYLQQDSGSGYGQVSGVARLNSSAVTTSPIEVSSGQNLLIRLVAYVDTSTRDAIGGGGYRYHLMPGGYSFTATLNCLVE